MDFDALLTGPEFERYTGGTVTRILVRVWHARGKLTAVGYRGRSPLFRLGDLLDVERGTRQQVRARGGRRRQSSAA